MYTISRSAMVPHSAEQMFALVNDVDSYSLFLPWCGSSRVLQHENHTMIASVEIAFKGISKTFTTRNTMQPFEATQLQLVDGPFSELTGRWGFKPLSDDACKISLDLEFGFSNRLVGAVVGPVFKIIADSMVDSFCKRAGDVYGSS